MSNEVLTQEISQHIAIRCWTGQKILKDTFLGFSPGWTGLTIAEVLATIFSKKNSNLRHSLTTMSSGEAVFKGQNPNYLGSYARLIGLPCQFAQYLVPCKSVLQKPVSCFSELDLQTFHFWGGWKLSCWGADSSEKEAFFLLASGKEVCGGSSDNAPVFEDLVPSLVPPWWNCVGRVRKCVTGVGGGGSEV